MERILGINADIIELPWALEYIADDAFSSDYVIFLNGVCTEYTWQWVKRHPELSLNSVVMGNFQDIECERTWITWTAASH